MLYGLFDKDQLVQLDSKESSEFLTVAIKQSRGSFTVSENQAKMAMKAIDKDSNDQLGKD